MRQKKKDEFFDGLLAMVACYFVLLLNFCLQNCSTFLFHAIYSYAILSVFLHLFIFQKQSFHCTHLNWLLGLFSTFLFFLYNLLMLIFYIVTWIF